MKKSFFVFSEERRTDSSKLVSILNGCINAVFNPLKQKGGFKILKKPIIYFGGMLLCLPVLSVSNNKEIVFKHNNLQEG
jgi:hypothetical protein